MGAIERATRPTMQQRLATGINRAKNTAIERAIVQPSAWALSPLANRWAENVGKGQPLEYAPDVQDKLIKAARHGCQVIFGSDHTSDEEAIQEAYPMKDMVDLMNEFLPKDQQIESLAMITADSLRRGGQRVGERIVFDALKRKFLKRHYIQPVFRATTNDTGIRRMDGNNTESLRTANSLIQTGHWGVFVYPEGSIRGGKLNSATGQRFGMQRFIQNSITTYVTLMKATGREVVIVPMSTYGAWDIYDHTNSKPSMPIVKAGLCGPSIPPLVHTYIGSPMRTDEEPLATLLARDQQMRKEDQGRLVEDFLGGVIASHLPIKQQGYYSQTA